MNRADTFECRNFATATILFGVSVAMRVLFRSQFAYHWDSAQFALAVDNYDLRLSQPQAPGYFLYVMLGRLVSWFVGDPHASLVWISVVAGSALVAIGYLLGTAMFGARCGWAAGVILATSPLCWFHSEVALTSIVDAALVTATVLVCWLTVRDEGGWGHVVMLAVLMALVAGVRQQSGPILVPVWLCAFAGMSRPRWPKFVAGVVLTGLLCLAWFVPMVQMSGGLASYWAALAAKARFDAPKTPWRGGLAALWLNVDLIVEVCWAGLLMAAVIATWLLGRRILGEGNAARLRLPYDHHRQWRLLALWIVSGVAFGMGTYMTMAGYVLSYFPGLVIAVAMVIGQVKRRAELVVLLVLVALVNCATFLSLGCRTSRFMLGLPLTAIDLREHDRNLAQVVEQIRNEFDPKDVVICHGSQHFWFGFRHFQYYLPEYRNVLLARDPSMPGMRAEEFWVGRARRTEFALRFEPGDASTLLLVIPQGQQLSLFAPHIDVHDARVLDGSGGAPYKLAEVRLGQVQK